MKVSLSSEDIVLALFVAFAERDVDAALALVAPEFEFWPQGTAGRTGRGAPYNGPEGLREYFADVARVWEHLRVEPGDLRVAGGGVVAFGTAHGRALGEPAPVDVPVIWVFKVAGDRVTSARVVATAAEADAALASADAW